MTQHDPKTAFQLTDDLQDVDRAANDNKLARVLPTVNMTAVEPEEDKWHWQPYIPDDELTLLHGDPGVGKSWFVLWYALRSARKGQRVLILKEIEARLSSWDAEQLLLAQEYFTKQEQAKPPQTGQPPLQNNRIAKMATERTLAAALIALGLVLAALIVRGGYEVAGTSLGAYVVNRFTGVTWQCADVCVRLETFTPEKKK